MTSWLSSVVSRKRMVLSNPWLLTRSKRCTQMHPGCVLDQLERIGCANNWTAKKVHAMKNELVRLKVWCEERDLWEDGKLTCLVTSKYLQVRNGFLPSANMRSPQDRETGQQIGKAHGQSSALLRSIWVLISAQLERISTTTPTSTDPPRRRWLHPSGCSSCSCSVCTRLR